MSETVRHALLLEQGTVLRVHDGRGVSIRVYEGEAWITQEGDPQDVILLTGEAWRISRNGATLIQALCPVRLALAAERSREGGDTKATFSFAPLAPTPADAHEPPYTKGSTESRLRAQDIGAAPLVAEGRSGPRRSAASECQEVS